MPDVIEWDATLLPSSSNFYLQHNTRQFTSPITRTQQSIKGQGERYVCDLTFDNISLEKGRKIDALLARLQGSYNTVALWNFERPEPGGDNRDTADYPTTYFEELDASTTTFDDDTGFSGGDGIVRVEGSALARATSVRTSGWYSSVTGILLAGDYVGIDSRIYMLTEDADSDATGEAVLMLSPALRADVAHRAVVTRTRPTSPFRLINDDQPSRRVVPGLFYSFSLSLVEAL